MSITDIDPILAVLENPIRRKIIKRLTEEPNYPLRLAKELGLGQQLVAKHLAIMEEAGVVTSVWEVSPNGPRRRKYLLNQSISITFDLAPHLFTTKIQSYGTPRQSMKIRAETDPLLKRIAEIKQSPDEKTRINIARKLIEKIDEKITTLETERAQLLQVRNLAMQEASEALTTLQMEHEGRRILLRILDEHDLDVEGISRALNLRESLVRQILAQFE